jgi:hypothetical protein
MGEHRTGWRGAARAATALVGTVGALGLGMTGAGADTRHYDAVATTCRDGQATFAATVDLTVAAPAEVPEDGAALVRFGVSLPATDAGLAVTGAQLTVDIPVAVADVDLTFAGGTVAARTWDARGGERIVVSFVAPEPVARAEARLPDITVVNTFDPGTTGTAVDWPVFRSLAVSVVDAGGARTIGCTTAAPGAVVGTTRITAPSAPHDRAIAARDAVIRVGAPPDEAVVGEGAGPGAAAPAAAPGAVTPGLEPAAPGADGAEPAPATVPASAADPAGPDDPARGDAPEAAAPLTAVSGPAATGPGDRPVALIAAGLAAAAVLAGGGAVVLARARRPAGPPKP